MVIEIRDITDHANFVRELERICGGNENEVDGYELKMGENRK